MISERPSDIVGISSVPIAKPEMQAPYDQNNVIFVASIDGAPDSVANGVAYPFPL
jgi:hypothetical protein